MSYGFNSFCRTRAIQFLCILCVVFLCSGDGHVILPMWPTLSEKETWLCFQRRLSTIAPQCTLAAKELYLCCIPNEKRLVQLQTRATTHGWVFESKHTGLAVWLSDWLDATMVCYCVLYGNGTLFNDCCLLSPYHCDEPWFVELFINGHCICSCICCANFVGFEANVPASIPSSSASCRSVCSKKRHAHIPSRTPRNVIPLVFSTGSVWPFIRCFQYADFYIGMQSKIFIPGLLAPGARNVKPGKSVNFQFFYVCLFLNVFISLYARRVTFHDVAVETTRPNAQFVQPNSPNKSEQLPTMADEPDWRGVNSEPGPLQTNASTTRRGEQNINHHILAPLLYICLPARSARKWESKKKRRGGIVWRLLRRFQSDGPGRFMLLRGALYFGCAPIMVSTCCTHVPDMFSKKGGQF